MFLKSWKGVRDVDVACRHQGASGSGRRHQHQLSGSGDTWGCRRAASRTLTWPRPQQSSERAASSRPVFAVRAEADKTCFLCSSIVWDNFTVMPRGDIREG